jgi:Spy/CpxP family protein refolding chaperone
MKRRTIVTSVVAGIVLCGLGAVAAPHLASHENDGGPLRTFIHEEFGLLRKLHSDLDLTKDQREQIHDVLKDHRDDIAGVVKPLVEKRRALREAVMAENPDEAKIRSAANDLGKAIGDAAVLASKVKPEIGKVLTSKQKEKLKDFRQESDKKVDEFVEAISSHS